MRLTTSWHVEFKNVVDELPVTGKVGKSKVSLELSILKKSYSNSLNLFVLDLGQELPLRIAGHSMVPLGFGQAILGGRDPSNNSAYYSAIYHMKCSQHICEVLQLDKRLSVPRSLIVVIPIPDSMAQCLSESKL